MHKINKGDGVRFQAVLFRIRGKKYRRLEMDGVGYALDTEYNNMVHIDNGVMILLVRTEDIIENYGNKVIFAHKNDRYEREVND